MPNKAQRRAARMAAQTTAASTAVTTAATNVATAAGSTNPTTVATAAALLVAPTAPTAPTVPNNSTQPVMLVAVNPKRGLTGNGSGKYSNANTMAHMLAQPNATTTGYTYSQWYAICKAFNHKLFTAYAVKSGWLVPVANVQPAPNSAQGVVTTP